MEPNISPSSCVNQTCTSWKPRQHNLPTTHTLLNICMFVVCYNRELKSNNHKYARSVTTPCKKSGKHQYWTRQVSATRITIISLAVLHCISVCGGAGIFFILKMLLLRLLYRNPQITSRAYRQIPQLRDRNMYGRGKSTDYFFFFKFILEFVNCLIHHSLF